jgi:Leucine-rich repeat (LRR) protein
MTSTSLVLLSLLLLSVLSGIKSDEDLAYNKCHVNQIEPPYVCEFTVKSDHGIKWHLSNSSTNFTGIEIVIVSFETARFPTEPGQHASSCGIKSLTREDFKNFTRLTYLDLDFNEIKELSADVFADLVVLDHLSLYGVLIKVLPENVFENNIQLHWFEAQESLIEELPEKLFLNNPRISILQFKDGKLKSIKVGFTKLKLDLNIDFTNYTYVNATLTSPKGAEVKIFQE